MAQVLIQDESQKLTVVDFGEQIEDYYTVSTQVQHYQQESGRARTGITITFE